MNCIHTVEDIVTIVCLTNNEGCTQYASVTGEKALAAQMSTFLLGLTLTAIPFLFSNMNQHTRRNKLMLT